MLAAGASALLLGSRQVAAETYNSPAVESSVISATSPDENLMVRPESNVGVSINANLLMVNPQEYFIFKFDFSDMPANATITTPGVFNWATWYTHASPGDPLGQTRWGDFEFHEITAGDAAWEGNQFSDGSVSPGAVTYNNLNGTFTNLAGVTEIDSGEGPALVPDLLVGDGGFGTRQSLGGIPVATLQRLRSGQSVGLAMASLADTNMSIHSKDTFLADQDKDPRLVFDWTTDVVLDPADFDEDGDVDATDLATWQTSYGSGAGADTDLDGDSDGSDFLVWQQNKSAAVGITSVPEPSSILLIGLAMSMLATTSRSRVR